MNKNINIHWFRRDLRIAGNPALRNQLKKSNSVLGIFFFDSKFLSRDDFSHNRFAFFLETLKQLKADLNEVGSDLLVVDEQPAAGFQKLINFFKVQKAENIYITFNKDYEPFARHRDQIVSDLFVKNAVKYESFKDHLIFEPDEIFKSKKGDFYQIFTPYYNKWKKTSEDLNFKKQLKEEEKGLNFLKYPKKERLFEASWKIHLNSKDFPFVESLDRFYQQNKTRISIRIPKAGSLAGVELLQQFRQKQDFYSRDRDYPQIRGTSELSRFFKNGSLTTKQVLFYLNSLDENCDKTFLKEIVWREFYYSILFYRPDVEKNSFKPECNNINWQNNLNWFESWKQGLTGFPIVDAGMRQLNQTGWMHNRVRMIVASFLVKDLLIDWRWGENYFMKTLLDGDLAPNNGGWQWAASTGCDAQPYFRVFNPWLQAEKFDPEAQYIKNYVPELKNLAASVIHDPNGLRPGYPKPIVNHAIQKEKAIALFKK